MKFDGKEDVSGEETLVHQIKQASKQHKFSITGGKNQTVTWRSAQENYATIDGNGNVIFKGWNTAFKITVTQPATCYKNKCETTISLVIKLLGKNTVTFKKPEKKYFKDKIDDLNSWLKNVMASAGPVKWHSSPRALTIENGIAKAGTGFKSTTIELTATADWNTTLEKVEEKFTFTFHEHWLIANNLKRRIISYLQ